MVFNCSLIKVNLLKGILAILKIHLIGYVSI